jgi:hypothetical protein
MSNAGFPIPGGKEACLVIETARTWRPAEVLGAADSRTLAVGLGRPLAVYPATLPEADDAAAERAVYDRWEGPSGGALVASGVGRMRFACPAVSSVIKLWVRGEKVQGMGPVLVIRLGGAMIARTMLREEGWQSLALASALKPSEHLLSVECTDDFSPAETSPGERVFLGRLEVATARRKAG